MRTRPHFIGLWLNDTEYEHLTEQCSVTGLSASAIVRELILGVELHPRPPDSSKAILRELAAIGNNVNQIAHWANAKKGVTDPEMETAAALVRKAYQLVKEAY